MCVCRISVHAHLLSSTRSRPPLIVMFTLTEIVSVSFWHSGHFRPVFAAKSGWVPLIMIFVWRQLAFGGLGLEQNGYSHQILYSHQIHQILLVTILCTYTIYLYLCLWQVMWLLSTERAQMGYGSVSIGNAKPKVSHMGHAIPFSIEN